MSMLNYLFVGLGAAVGGIGRYWLSGVVQNLLPLGFPYGTLTVNLLGSFILGLIMFTVEAEVIIRPEYRLFWTVGMCGALTTFSTFSFETLQLIRDAEFVAAGLNVLLNVILTLAALIVALGLVRKFMGG
ncbi:MAG: fluoride efflux transporter CrcB [Candidatus Marinimicrobia bacterium]|nr:fluoride efflux transporter CrcB [Candidatus Neomarinimicrobiota bacterium]